MNQSMIIDLQGNKMSENKEELKSASARVVHYLMDRIASRDLDIGDRLPPERELAQMLDVSRASVREGLRVLNHMGFLDSTQGSGNYVSENYTSTVQEIMYLMYQRRDISYRDITLFRCMLEQQAVDLAMDRMTEAQKDELRQLVGRMDMPEDERVLFELDHRFHTVIAEASGNPLVVINFKALTAIIYHYMDESYHSIVSQTASGFPTLQKYHHAIVDAIFAGDRTAAHQAMEDHFRMLLLNKDE